ncbi:CTP synthetase [Candidatus Omnitrophus magneticus]|uniref:CTP synthase n=1 Tax=Candidatus Omnitrophus magneticus TaxID=1609969 RepID=A0A0F0CX78_9BACT|nr:CTP synthetase [Candidatus Omnitrophus magneticus]
MPKKNKTKYIFVTGGVISSLGKGIASACIGKILEWNGYKTAIMKCDPYINVDPGTMNPYQHGEVYVTDDGTETDLDLGHYYRYTLSPLTKESNITTGKIYRTVIEKERRGDFLGGTVQVIPHITNEIKNGIRLISKKHKVDIIIVEIGGTVGDIEGLPFLEAIRQMKNEEGFQNAINIHLTLIPYIKAAGELKTKPTQHSVGKLREIGIQPEILMVRTEKSLAESEKEKIALFCNVYKDCVIEARDVEDIYEIPLRFKKDKLDRIILSALNLKFKEKLNSSKWEKIVETRKNAKSIVRIGVIGKYITLQDAYKSIDESLKHASIANNVKLELIKIEADTLENKNDAALHETFKGIQGILVPGGFGSRGTLGKIIAAKYARENNIPYFGICLGMQIAAIEFARNVCGLKNADSTEFNKKTKYPVISLLTEQKKIKDMGGTMRLGEYECVLKQNTRAANAYAKKNITERHRHRYEFNSKFIKQFEEKGLIISGIHPKGSLVEIIELKNHPWFLACQFHPEFKSKPDNVHPLFRDFIKSAKHV